MLWRGKGMKAGESLDLDTNECEMPKSHVGFMFASYRNISRPKLLVVCARPGSFSELMRAEEASTSNKTVKCIVLAHPGH